MATTPNGYGSVTGVDVVDDLLGFYVDKKIAKIKAKAAGKSAQLTPSAPAAAAPAASAEPGAGSGFGKYVPYALGAVALIVVVVMLRK